MGRDALTERTRLRIMTALLAWRSRREAP